MYFTRKSIWKSLFLYLVCLFSSSVLNAQFINLRLIKHFELALLFLSDAVKLEKVVCEWVCITDLKIIIKNQISLENGRLNEYLET